VQDPLPKFVPPGYLLASGFVKPGYPRPKGATPLRASLAIAYKQCTSPDLEHGPPLVTGSCSSPQQASDQLTVGTLDANGLAANSVGLVRYDVIPGDPGTPADDADVGIDVSMTGVRLKSDLSGYTGELQATTTVRITDKANGDGAPEPATASDVAFPVTVPCTAGTCGVTTSFDAVLLGSAPEGQRSNWELGQIQVFDGGTDGVASTTGDNTLFADQGLFAP
jgi:hypothetical protein